MQPVNKLIALLINSCVSATFAQDTHYWTQQYGSRSALIGGIVVGGVRDNSAVFYNPGALALIEQENLSINASGYQYDMLTVKNGAGSGLDLNSNVVQIIPLMVTGLIKIKDHPNHSFGYGILARHQTGIKMSARNDSMINVIADYNAPGLEEYIGQYNLKTDLFELWTGITYAYRLNDNIAFGATYFVPFRSQSFDQSFVGRVFASDTVYQSAVPIVTANQIISFEYINLRHIIKLGAAFDFSKLKMGLSVTLPSFNMGGKAVVNADVSATNLNEYGNSLSSFIDSGLTSDDFVKYGLSTYTANDRQPQGNDNLPTDYRTPLSVAAGVEYTIGSTLLAFTAEWFDKVDLYNVTTPRNTEFLRPKSAKFGVTSDQLLRIRDGAKSIFNYGLGIEQPIMKSVILLADFRVNKTFAIQDSLPGLNMNVTNWDLYHFNAGVIFKGKIFDMNIGISYGYGRSNTNYQAINLTEPTEANFLTGETKLVQLFYDSWGVILGYTYYF